MDASSSPSSNGTTTHSHDATDRRHQVVREDGRTTTHGIIVVVASVGEPSSARLRGSNALVGVAHESASWRHLPKGEALCGRKTYLRPHFLYVIIIVHLHHQLLVHLHVVLAWRWWRRRRRRRRQRRQRRRFVVCSRIVLKNVLKKEKKRQETRRSRGCPPHAGRTHLPQGTRPVPFSRRGKKTQRPTHAQKKKR